MAKIKEIYLAGGCFWGVQAYIKKIKGVQETLAGYANGNIAAPSYKDVTQRDSGHAETVEVTYDADIIPLRDLLAYFLRIIDPTSVNKQGNDRGSQYRSGIYYIDKTDLSIIKSVLELEQRKYEKPIVVEVMPLAGFYPAEEYHQDYLDNTPGGYCHIDLSLADEPLVKSSKYPKPSKQELKEKLSSIAYKVTQKNATEMAFSGEYWNHYQKGIYVDVATGEPLFSSSDKFESGCGWPSFSKPIDKNAIIKLPDYSMAMQRTEVRSSGGDSHLGHVFDDGPEELGGKRYCINSAAVRFIPYDDMDKEGYGELKELVE